MSLSLWILPGAALAALLLLKRLTAASPRTVRRALNDGARVIDVRSPGEFQKGHLPGAINIPLDRLARDIGRQAPDKDKPLLLHCLSGGRSAMGVSRLRHAGYTRCHNLGSYRRAQKLLAAAARE